jgi:GNAT superfamily N-acetyltransferase
VRIEETDPTDEAAFRAWYETFNVCQRHTWPDDPGWQFGEMRARALDPGKAWRLEHRALRDDAGDVVAVSRLELSLLDNLHLAGVTTVSVRPDHRRRGYGTALLRDAEELAAADGRTLVVVNVDEPIRSDDESPSRAFALRHGYSRAQLDLRRDLAVPVDEERLAALEAACAPHAAGYRFVAWRDRVPEEYLADRVLLARRMSTDAPQGDLTLEEESWDGARVRDAEALLIRQGRTFLAVGAVHEETGRMVAFTELGIPLAVPQRAYQWDTLVLKEHRGRRLGILAKLANLRALAAASPATTLVSTWNADDNAPMIAVNEALGCVVAGTFSSWQKQLAPA